MSENVTRASCDGCLWPSIATEPDLEQRGEADELRAERDGLLDQIGAMTEEISELLKKQPYTFDVDDVRGAIRLVGRYVDELTDELAKRDKGIARLKRRRDELERALEIDGRIKESQDGAIEEIARQRDEALEKLEEYEGSAETFTRLSDGSIYIGSKVLTEEVGRLARERDYWKREVELCMQAAYPPSHSPDRGYNPNVMAYPDRHGCTTPSTMVSDVIDGLRDAAQDGFFKAKLGDVVELEKERDQWRAKAERAIRAMNAAAGKWAKEEDKNAELTRKLETLKAHGVEVADAVSGGYEVYNEAIRERDEWRALAKSYEENYVGPLREAGFDVHAKAVAAALEAVDRENDRLKNELARTSADCEKWRAKFGKALDYADEIRRLA